MVIKQFQTGEAEREATHEEGMRTRRVTNTLRGWPSSKEVWGHPEADPGLVPWHHLGATQPRLFLTLWLPSVP
jgi:hypothetical protein